MTTRNPSHAIREEPPTAPTKPYVVRIYTSNSDNIKVFSGTHSRSANMVMLDESYTKALQEARRLTLIDGKARWVEIELCLRSVAISSGTADKPVCSWITKKLFMAEIENEEKDGARPATLSSALDSILTGYEPYVGFLKDTVSAEIEKLSLLYGEDATLEHFVSVEDWKKRE